MDRSTLTDIDVLRQYGDTYLVEYTPYGAKQDGVNKRLWAIIWDYNGEDIWDKGAMIEVSYKSAMHEFYRLAKVGVKKVEIEYNKIQTVERDRVTCYCLVYSNDDSVDEYKFIYKPLSKTVKILFKSSDTYTEQERKSAEDYLLEICEATDFSNKYLTKYDILSIKKELEDTLKAFFDKRDPEMNDPEFSGIEYEVLDSSIKFTVYAEVGYKTLTDICEALDKVVQKYSSDSYFEHETSGRAVCYLWFKDYKSIGDSKKVKDEEPEYTYEFDYSTDWEGFDKSYEEEVKDMSMQAKEYGCNLVDWKKLKGVPNCNIRIKVKGTKEKLKRLFRDLGIEDWDSFNKKLIKVKDEEPVTYYGLFQRGGSIGANANAEYRRYGDGTLLEVYLDREEAKAKAKQYRKYLTPGERSYYGMGYTVKPLYKSDLKNEYVQKLIAELNKGTKVEDSKKKAKKVKDSEEVSSDNREALDEYLEWEGILGYTEDIIEVYESESAFIDDEYKEFDDSYEALDAYLQWEGILGYTDSIYNILKHGYDSVYYENMVEDRDS